MGTRRSLCVAATAHSIAKLQLLNGQAGLRAPLRGGARRVIPFIEQRRLGIRSGEEIVSRGTAVALNLEAEVLLVPLLGLIACEHARLAAPKPFIEVDGARRRAWQERVHRDVAARSVVQRHLVGMAGVGHCHGRVHRERDGVVVHMAAFIRVREHNLRPDLSDQRHEAAHDGRHRCDRLTVFDPKPVHAVRADTGFRQRSQQLVASDSVRMSIAIPPEGPPARGSDRRGRRRSPRPRGRRCFLRAPTRRQSSRRQDGRPRRAPAP